MSEADELHRPSKHPRVHPAVMERFVHANISHPQMYGGMILRAGRVAYDLMLAGKLSVSTFSRSLPDAKQVAHMGQHAERAHKLARVGLMYLPRGSEQDQKDGFLTPIAMRGVYIRTRRGVLNTIHNYATTVLGLPEDIPADIARERITMTKELLKKKHRPAALLLQRIWQTADDAASGKPVAESTAILHRTFSALPLNRKERAADTASATRAARSTFDNLIVPALAPLKPEAIRILGNSAMGEDAIDLFPVTAIHEGAEEFSDEDIERIRTTGLPRDNL